MTADKSLELGRAALLGSMDGMVSRSVELKRVCRVAVIAGLVEAQAAQVHELVCAAQRGDGGWSDAEETAWCVAVMGAHSPVRTLQMQAASRWLVGVRSRGGGWGITGRDNPKLPTTALVLELCDAIRTSEDYNWIEDAWRADLASPLRLTYKGGFALRALSQREPGAIDVSLALRTVAFLSDQQNDDGGYGPWRGHPIGSDPWSTGICLVGICSFPKLANRDVVERAIQWLCKTQLASGYWPYHFIDEGSAYAYWGLTEATRFLELS